MAWSESGLYVSNVINSLNNTIGMDFTLTNAKLALYNNTDTPDFTVAAASAIYSVTNEVSGTGWAAGGVLVSAAASGGGSITPSITQSPTKSVMGDATDVSVASTTLSNARGLKWYFDSLTPKACWIGVNFGADYTTSAGTFAITWAALGIWVIKCVPSGA